MKIIEFKDCPQILQEEVLKTIDYRLNNYNWNTDITGCEERNSTPYKDKLITVTTYVVYTECMNAFETFKYEVCSDPEYNLRSGRVEHNSIIAGDIAGHIRHSKHFMTWFENDLKAAYIK